MNTYVPDAITPRDFRAAMGLFATGVTVVTTGHGDDVHAMTANAITSVSLHPPLLLFCVNKDATMAHRIRRNQTFTINILDETQTTLSHYFAGLTAGNTAPEFGFCEWASGSRLEECSAALGCRLYALHDGGDHWIAVGQVLSVYHTQRKTSPLLFYRGEYRQLAPYLGA
jgi:flavin reductase (DIM6/NTAB) family NADH-FMN oxidoreductase RutF